MNKPGISCIILLFISCTTGSHDNSESIITPEEFRIFFHQFSFEKDFQLQRILFPLEYYYSEDIGDETLSVEVINRNEWNYIDFRKDNASKTAKYDAFETSTDVLSDTIAIYQRLGIDNGIHMTYYFTRQNGKWFLKEIQDQSN